MFLILTSIFDALQNFKTLIDHNYGEHGKVAVAHVWQRVWRENLQGCSSA